MNANNVRRFGVVAASALVLTMVGPWVHEPPPSTPGTQVIVQAKSLMRASAAVAAVGGIVGRELGIIEAVSATLSQDQTEQIARRCPECRIYSDRVTRLMGSSDPDSGFPTVIGADTLHQNGITGKGVTVAIVDSGHLNVPQYQKDVGGQTRIKAQYDAFTNTTKTSGFKTDDTYGHGSHVTGVIVSSNQTSTGLYQGIAPDAGLVSVKAFDQNGGSTYATLIAGLNWVVTNKANYNIRVLNASFGASVGSWYWDDPMNQAIMKVWQAGIVVVASAGNTGPNSMTIQAPGNVPYVITVGAMTDHYTPSVGQDDYLASFSAAGPTFEAHIKPDLVAPGGHDLSWIPRTSTLGVQFPQYFVDTTSGYYQLSGTSQAAAVVSGVAALMLQAVPGLSPNDVKCGLMATAEAGQKNNGSVPYTVFQQGAGLVNAWSAVYDRRTGCANIGMDINADLAGTAHYAGQAAQNPNGSFYVKDAVGDGAVWDGAYSTTGGYPWSNGYPWSTSVATSQSVTSPTGKVVVVPGKKVKPVTSGITVVKPGKQQ